VYDDASLNIYNHIKTEHVDDIELCLCRFVNMKKTAKKTEFEYWCFSCRKQDDKARSYTRSYDLILHMINTHRKFSVEAKHNTYYAADGSDLRDATDEEIEKYRLAAMHKRRKPESPGEKSESTTRVIDDRNSDMARATKDEEKRRSGYSSHGRDANRRAQDKEISAKSERPISRDSRRGHDTDDRKSNRDHTARRGSGDSVGGRSTERDKKTKSTTGEEDDEERDRRKLAEIIKRMEDKKATKGSEVTHKVGLSGESPVTATITRDPKEPRAKADIVKASAKRTTESQNASKKSGIA